MPADDRASRFGAPTGFDPVVVERFFAAVHGGLHGLLGVHSIQRAPRPWDRPNYYTFVPYPGRLRDAIDWLRRRVSAGGDVYACAHLLKDRRRVKANALPLASLYGDVDHARLPASVPHPTVVVESSPGRWQAYWRLRAAVDPAHGELLNKRMALAAGADKSGYDLTQLLRVPGTPNRKYAEPPLVRLVHLGAETYDADELDRVLPRLPAGGGRQPRGRGPRGDSGGGAYAGPEWSRGLADDRVLARARAARNGAKFARLWAGRWREAGYGSPSEADFALVGLLAFWCGPSPAQIDRLFRRSGLYRDKWDEPRGAATYGEVTIGNALRRRFGGVAVVPLAATGAGRAG